jgi:hypothetical protein
MGTTLIRVRDTFKPDWNVLSAKVQQTTLDHYLEQHRLKVDLIKIDTEGNELNILKGSRQALAKLRPVIIFEAWPGPERRDLMSFFDDNHYVVCSLPVHVDRPPIPLTPSAFDVCKTNNFMGISSRSLAAWPAVFAN